MVQGGFRGEGGGLQTRVQVKATTWRRGFKVGGTAVHVFNDGNSDPGSLARSCRR